MLQAHAIVFQALAAGDGLRLLWTWLSCKALAGQRLKSLQVGGTARFDRSSRSAMYRALSFTSERLPNWLLSGISPAD